MREARKIEDHFLVYSCNFLYYRRDERATFKVKEIPSTMLTNAAAIVENGNPVRVALCETMLDSIIPRRRWPIREGNRDCRRGVSAPLTLPSANREAFHETADGCSGVLTNESN